MKKIIPVLLAFAILFSFAAPAAAVPAPDVEWARIDATSGYEGGMSVRQTSDGGYIVAGERWVNEPVYPGGPFRGQEVYLGKHFPSGDLEWSRTFGGPGAQMASSVRETSDGGFILTGRTNHPSGSGWNLLLVKTSFDGTEEWSRDIGDLVGHERGYAVRETADGGYIIVGSTFTASNASDENVYLVKTDSGGIVEWSRTYGGEDRSSGYSVEPTVDGGYIVAGTWEVPTMGSSGPYPSKDALLLKVDGVGTVEWRRLFGGERWDLLLSVQPTVDGGFVAGGYTYSYSDVNALFYLVKTDAEGGEEWVRTFGSDGYDWGREVAQTAAGGYLLAGSRWDVGYPYNRYIYLVKTNGNGWMRWSKLIAEEDYWSGIDAEGYSAQETEDGGIIVTGTTRALPDEQDRRQWGTNIYLVKLGPENENPGGAVVGIDIKPGNSKNVINLKKEGVTKVAVLTSPEFDATIVDPATVLLAGAGITKSGAFRMKDVDHDGDLDLVLDIDTGAMQLDVLATEAELTGMTYGGDAFHGADIITIVNFD